MEILRDHFITHQCLFVVHRSSFPSQHTAQLSHSVSAGNTFCLFIRPYFCGYQGESLSEFFIYLLTNTIYPISIEYKGMGIDLAHVRYVLHWSMAKTVEGFYQESGRGGRDGLPAKSILYYSKDDASLFAFIIKKGAEGKAARRMQQTQDDRALTELQNMVDYCTTACCRRKYLLAHFGERINPQDVCSKTCDFCINPQKTERAIQSSQVSRDVAKMVQRSSGSFKKQQEWDGQWSKPHGDSDDEYGSDIDADFDGGESSLGIKRSGDVLKPEAPKASVKGLGGFVKASSVLEKYQKMEMKTGGKSSSGGFVNFRARDTAPATVPAHLRKNAPDPLQSYYNKPKAAKKNEGSAATKSRIEQLKAELAAEDA